MAQSSTCSTRRQFIYQLSGLALSVAGGSKIALASETLEVRVQRLNWAGIRIVSGNTDLYIDTVITDIWDGDSPYPLVKPEDPSSRAYALITHTHTDHFDSAGLKELLGDRGRIFCATEMATYIASQGHRVIPVNQFQSEQRGPFTVMPLPAIDGLGGKQVAWLVLAGGKRYLHCGDTIWHGAWRKWGNLYGPFDAVFLPINGARQADVPASEIPLSMDPYQAVDAAILLGAKKLVPIHYGYHVPGEYEEFPDALNVLQSTAARRGLKVELVVPGSWMEG